MRGPWAVRGHPCCQPHPIPTWVWLSKGTSGRLRRGIEDREKGTLSTPRLGPCPQPAVSLELEKPVGEWGLGAWHSKVGLPQLSHLSLPLAQDSYWRVQAPGQGPGRLPQEGTGNKGLFFRT